MLPWAVVYLTDAAWILYCCLWHRLAAVAPVQLLDWELPYAVGAALKDHTHKKKKKKKKKDLCLWLYVPTSHLIFHYHGYSHLCCPAQTFGMYCFNLSLWMNFQFVWQISLPIYKSTSELWKMMCWPHSISIIEIVCSLSPFKEESLNVD